MAKIETVALYHKTDGHEITVNADEIDQFPEYQKTKPSGGGKSSGSGSGSTKSGSGSGKKTNADSESVDSGSDNV
jgi:hypothetical protein